MSTAEEHVRLLRAMAALTAVAPHAGTPLEAPPEASAHTNATEMTEPVAPMEGVRVFGPAPAPAPLAFLPNLMPTYKTSADDVKTVYMFSLVHQTPTMDQGWRLMLRGLHLQPVLVDRTTLTILERLGAVEWKPLPGGEGVAGVFCRPPTAAPLAQVTPITPSPASEDDVTCALEQLSVHDLDAGDADQAGEEDAQPLDLLDPRLEHAMRTMYQGRGDQKTDDI